MSVVFNHVLLKWLHFISFDSKTISIRKEKIDRNDFAQIKKTNERCMLIIKTQPLNINCNIQQEADNGIERMTCKFPYHHISTWCIRDFFSFFLLFFVSFDTTSFFALLQNKEASQSLNGNCNSYTFRSATSTKKNGFFASNRIRECNLNNELMVI